jgi:hypothetical protein
MWLNGGTANPPRQVKDSTRQMRKPQHNRRASIYDIYLARHYAGGQTQDGTGRGGA